MHFLHLLLSASISLLLFGVTQTAAENSAVTISKETPPGESRSSVTNGALYLSRCWPLTRRGQCISCTKDPARNPVATTHRTSNFYWHVLRGPEVPAPPMHSLILEAYNAARSKPPSDLVPRQLFKEGYGMKLVINMAEESRQLTYRDLTQQMGNLLQLVPVGSWTYTLFGNVYELGEGTEDEAVRGEFVIWNADPMAGY